MIVLPRSRCRVGAHPGLAVFRRISEASEHRAPALFSRGAGALTRVVAAVLRAVPADPFDPIDIALVAAVIVRAIRHDVLSGFPYLGLPSARHGLLLSIGVTALYARVVRNDIWLARILLQWPIRSCDSGPGRNPGLKKNTCDRGWRHGHRMLCPTTLLRPASTGAGTPWMNTRARCWQT